MSQINFLKIDQIEGESKDRQHSREIDVLSWNWAFAVSGPTSGTGRGTRGPLVSGITFSHYIDNASPKLMKACLAQSHILRAKLSVRPEAPSTFDNFTLALDDVTVKSVNQLALEGCNRTIETVVIEFKKVTEEYTPTRQDGTPGQKVSTTYDISTNQVT